jgi:hypothetical protein
MLRLLPHSILLRTGIYTVCFMFKNIYQLALFLDYSLLAIYISYFYVKLATYTDAAYAGRGAPGIGWAPIGFAAATSAGPPGFGADGGWAVEMDLGAS